MKNLSLILIFLLISCATVQVIPEIQHNPYTYDGPLDPGIFFKWPIVESWLSGLGFHHIIVKNPDEDADIPYAELIATNTTTVAYVYFSIEEGVWHFFAMTPQGHYAEIPDTKDGI